jgi:hypothetical protein
MEELISEVREEDQHGHGFSHQPCSRRLNIDPPCRFNIDPGRVAAV